MAVNLNLLPPDLQINKGLGRILKTIKSINVILIVAFIVFSLGVGGFFVVSKISLNSVQSSVDKLKSQVKAQETSEQKLILLKDRLSKIYSIKSTPSASKNIDGANSLLTNVSPNSTMDQAVIEPTKADISLKVQSNEDLGILFTNIKNTSSFKFIDLYSFDYSPSVGYLVKLNMNNK